VSFDPIWRNGLYLTVLCLIGAVLQPHHSTAFTLMTPVSGTELRSGESVPVSVEAGNDVSLRSIRYYWYRLDEEPLASHQASPAVLNVAENGAPFSGTLQIPKEAIGTMRLLAVGEVTRGRLGTYEDFDEVLVKVEPVVPLLTIEFATEKPWRLNTIGKRVELPVVGQFQDGVVRPLTGLDAGSRFSSSEEEVFSIDAAGVVQVMGNGKAQITVENRGKVGTLDVLVDADTTPNRAPTAQVEKELHVKSGSLVVLDGLRSRDPDGDPLRYEWKQVRGHRVALSNVNEVKATFMAPKVSEPKQYQFMLTVTDMAGPDALKGADSRPAVITVWVTP
jgi:hypothetical protein